MEPDAADIASQLLQKDPSARLGHGKGEGASGEDQIKAHPFFKDIDWCKLLAKELEPPFKPPQGDATLNFNKVSLLFVIRAHPVALH